MLVFLPVSFKEIKEKSRWFEKPVARKINGNVSFGFEIKKPSMEGLRTFGEPSYPYGIHFHNDISIEAQKFDDQVDAALRLKPLYAVLQGMKVNLCPPKENGFRFLSELGAIDYRKSMEQFVDFAKRLKRLNLPIAIENTAITEFVTRAGVLQPKLYFNLRIGTFSRDLQAVQKSLDCQIVLDIEHLSYALNYVKRKFQYSRLPKVVFSEMTFTEAKNLDEYGLFIRKGFPLAVSHPLNFKEEIKNTGARIYHLSGCQRRIGYIEIIKDRIVNHGPIHLNDKEFRRNLRIILAQKPEVLVLEVGRAEDNACWSYRSQDVQEKSFENFCKMLGEELNMEGGVECP